MTESLAQLGSPLLEVDGGGLPLFSRGKVRDTFDLGDRLLMIASDRISAFDVNLPNGIPDKGALLTQMSRWWFDRTADICPNHIDGSAPWPAELAARRATLESRSMLVRRAKRIDVECIVRGYLAGSGWKEYREEGTLAGEALPAGLAESERLPEARFTPSTKVEAAAPAGADGAALAEAAAATGADGAALNVVAPGHDENISVERMAEMVGAGLTEELRDLSLRLYAAAAATALERGVILADTKLEFGFIDGRVHLIDECFTPDSSRYWDAKTYRPGEPQPSMDKQYLRDYLESIGWDKKPPAPDLPDEVVLGVRDRYLDAYRRVTGREFA